MNAPTFPLRRRLAAVAALMCAALCVTRAADRLVPLAANPGIARGMHRDDVVLRLGQPDETVSTGIWVYWDFSAKGRPPGDHLNTLVVFFAKDRVTWLRLTERSATIALLHQLRMQQAAAADHASAGQ
jgi:hypothetical protein